MANKNIVAQLEKNKMEVEKKQEEIKQLKNKERKILSTQRKAEQQIRTRRLIERGAVLGSINPSILSISNEKLKIYLQQILQTGQGEKDILWQSGLSTLFSTKNIQPVKKYIHKGIHSQESHVSALASVNALSYMGRCGGGNQAMSLSSNMILI